MHSSQLPALRQTLSMLPFDWALWAVDARGTLLLHDGPAMRHKGMPPGHGVGTCVREMNRGNPEAVAFVDAVLEGPVSGWITFGTTRYFVQGAPMEDGGAVAISLPCVGPGVWEEGAPSARDGAEPPVIEVARAIPELGAEAGDLLVFDPESPAYAGLFRRLWIGELPEGLLDEMARLSRARDEAPAEPPPGDASAAPPGRPAHLRLLP
jgi:hypothetical protein